MAKRIEEYVKISEALYDCHGPTYYPNPEIDKVIGFLRESCIPREIVDGQTRGNFDWYIPGGVVNIRAFWSVEKKLERMMIDRTVRLEIMPYDAKIPKELSDYFESEGFRRER